GPEGEHQQRHDEAPEIELPAVAEGMADVGGLGGAPEPVEQQHLVDGVHQGVNAFAQHRGAAGQPGGHELHRGDRQVAGEGGPDDLVAFRSLLHREPPRSKPTLPRVLGCRPLRHAAAVLLLATLSLPASAAPETNPPRRIVSTSPSVTEILFALGLGDRVVGVCRYCRYPAATLALPKVGSFLKPDAESIARLAPDLVLLHSQGDGVMERLSAVGLRCAAVGEAAGL